MGVQQQLPRRVGIHPAGKIDDAIKLCAQSNAALPDMGLLILRSRTRDEADLQNVADAAALSVIPRLTRRLQYLPMLANVATLLGLLGTIFGLMTAFSGVGAADPSQRSAFLAAGISEALNTTAFGLIVAVPAMLMHAFFVNRVERVADSMDETIVRLARVISGGATETAMVAPGRPASTAAAPHAVPRTDPRAPQARSHR